MIPELNVILEELNCLPEELKLKITLLYETLKGLNNKVNTEELAEEIMNSIFNPFKCSKETMIPFSFYKTSLGKLMANVFINDMDVYSVSELAKLAGRSRQYINQDIGQGRLQATKKGASWRISKSEGDRYIKLKRNTSKL